MSTLVVYNCMELAYIGIQIDHNNFFISDKIYLKYLTGI